MQWRALPKRGIVDTCFHASLAAGHGASTRTPFPEEYTIQLACPCLVTAAGHASLAPIGSCLQPVPLS